MTPGFASLKQILEECGVGLSAAQADQLWHYHRLLRAADAELNLTRIRNFENMVLKHYVDSLLVLRFEEPLSPMLDLGTGPGLPGIPLKIARPGLHVILADTRGPRTEFLTKVCGQMRLEGIEVHAGSITPRYGRPVRSVITRAVATIQTTLDDLAGCLETGGRVLFMKGPECDDEIREASRTHGSSYRLLASHAYEIPGTTHRRRLVVFERVDAPGVTESLAPSRTASFAGAAREVSSSTNPLFKNAREALTGKGIRKHGRALVSGSRIVAEVLDRFSDRAEAWLTDTKGEPPPEGAPSDLVWLRLSGELFRELDVVGTHAPLLLVRVPEMTAWSDVEPWPEGCTLFVPFQDPENVGAIIRSAAAFGVARVVLLREAAHPFHPKSVRAAGPALFQVPLLTGPSISELRAGAPMMSLDGGGDPLHETEWPERFGLVAGLEGPGLPDRFRRPPFARRIPIAQGVESLNAATSTAVALYEWSRHGGAGIE